MTVSGLSGREQASIPSFNKFSPYNKTYLVYMLSLKDQTWRSQAAPVHIYLDNRHGRADILENGALSLLEIRSLGQCTSQVHQPPNPCKQIKIFTSKINNSKGHEPQGINSYSLFSSLLDFANIYWFLCSMRENLVFLSAFLFKNVTCSCSTI